MTYAQLTARWRLFPVADANQKVLRSGGPVGQHRERGRAVHAEIQSSAVEAVKDGQSYVLRQDEMQDAPRDPLNFYQKGVPESVERAAPSSSEGTARP
jgi:hypothetical protein